VFAGSVGFEQLDMEDVVNFPFSRQREVNGKRGDDFLDLEWTMIFVV